MTVTFFINYLNHHQVSVADELYTLLGDDFHFVATLPRNVGELKGGEDYSSRSYCILAAEKESDRREAQRLVMESDVCVFGFGCLEWEKMRAETGKLAFEISERWFKRGLINILSPRLVKWWWVYQTKLRRAPFYKLCASAFTASDCQLLGTYKNKCFKWGYFPSLTSKDVICTFEISSRKPVLIWVGRMISWKHPEVAVLAARNLDAMGYDFSLEMYGEGPKKENIEKLIKKLNLTNKVLLKGNRPNKEIQAEMASADMFLFTSDRNEGWGAVLNEAMSNACCVVANDCIGSVPYLIENGVNGFTYSNGSVSQLTSKIKFLFDNPSEREAMAQKARTDILSRWNPQIAARNFINLSNNLLHGLKNEIACGPCSKA